MNLKFFLSVFAISASFAISAENLLKNGSFEEWPEGKAWPTWWEVSYDQKTLKPEELTRANGEKGGNAVKFTDSNLGHMLRQTVPVVAGEYYDVSFRTKPALRSWVLALMLFWQDAAGKNLPNGAYLSDTGVGEWREVSKKNLKAPEGAVKAYIGIGANSGHSPGEFAAGSFLIDDVYFGPAKSETAGEFRALASIPLFEETSINIDGVPDEPAWKKGMTIGNFTTRVTNSPDVLRTRVTMCADKENIYFFATMKSKDPASLAKVKQERDKGQMSDMLEIFIKPDPTSKYQYQFMIDPAGSLWDNRQAWNDFVQKGQSIQVENDGGWNAPGFTAVTKQTTDGWTAEIKIPFADLGVQVSEGTSWRANICRSDYGKSGAEWVELSSWSPFPDLPFAYNVKWGEWTFRKNIPVIADMAPVSSGKATVLMKGAPDKASKVEMRVERLDGIRAFTLGTTTFEIPASKENVSVETTLNAESDIYWISVLSDGNLLYRSGGRSLGNFVSLTRFDPYSVRGNKLHIASDMRTYSWFTATHTFETKLPVKRLLREQKKVDFVFELPEGVTTTSISIREWNSFACDTIIPVKGETVRRNGIDYRQFIYEPPAIDEESPLVFFETTWPEGRKGKAYIYARWDGGTELPREYELETVKVGTIKPFKRLFSRFDYMPASFMYQWFNYPAEMLPKLGINQFWIPLNPSKTGFHNSKKKQNEYYDRLVPELKKRNAFLVMQNDVLPVWYSWTEGKDPDPDSVFIGRDRKPVKSQYGPATFCTMYRGRHYQKWINDILSSEAVKKYGATWIIADFEFWPKLTLEDGCYCDSCLKAFPSWCHERQKNDFGDPVVFMKSGSDEKACAAWKEYSIWRRQQLFQNVRDVLAKGIGQPDYWSGPQNKFLLSEWTMPQSHPELIGILDYFDMNVYYQPQLVMDRFTMALETTKGEHRMLVAALCPAQGWMPNARMLPEENIYNIFESAVGGVQGFEWFWYGLFDTLRLKVMVDGYRFIRPFEDIILDGKIIASVPCSGGNASARSITLGDESLLYVRDYGTKTKFMASVKFKCDAGSDVFDVKTGEKIGSISSDRNLLELELGSDLQGRLLYVGAHYSERLKAAQE